MLKPIEPMSSVTTVWHLDPDVESYPDNYTEQIREDPSAWRQVLTIKDGGSPTLFEVGVIPPSVLARIESDALFPSNEWRMHEMFWACFRAGLRDIKSGAFGVVPKVAVNGVEYVDPEWLERTFIRSLRGCGLFLGRIAWQWNTAHDSDVKNL
jgi:hypothetical protein